MLRLVIIDDHPLFTEGLATILAEKKVAAVVGLAASAREGLRVAHECDPDVVTLDVGLPGTTGLAVVKDLRRAAPNARILMLTMYADPALVTEAFASGAGGYALKSQPPSEIVEAIQKVASGERYVAPGLPADAVVVDPRKPTASEPLRGLSRREREIFDLVVRGFSTDAIAVELYISPKTVETHRARINRKLATHSPSDLLRFATRHGLLRAG
jgi:DNA-binding NarL/FixJ family response regulator